MPRGGAGPLLGATAAAAATAQESVGSGGSADVQAVAGGTDTAGGGGGGGDANGGTSGGGSVGGSVRQGSSVGGGEQRPGTADSARTASTGTPFGDSSGFDDWSAEMGEDGEGEDDFTLGVLVGPKHQITHINQHIQICWIRSYHASAFTNDENSLEISWLRSYFSSYACPLYLVVCY